MRYFEYFYLKSEENIIKSIKDILYFQDIDVRDEENCTLLGTAIEFRRTEIVIFLLEKGSDPNIKSQNRYPLELASKIGELELCKILLNNGAYIQDDNHALAIGLMMRTGYEFAEFLLNNGANPNDMFDDETALWWACQAMDEHTVELLLKMGANPDYQDSMGVTCLTQAIADSFILGVRLLIKYGADVNFPTNNPPLHMALSYCYPAMNILLDSGADINIIDADGRTVLFIERVRDNLITCDYLIRRGADPGIKDALGIDYFMLNDSNIRDEIMDEYCY